MLNASICYWAHMIVYASGPVILYKTETGLKLLTPLSELGQDSQFSDVLIA